jgi:hypothetical protein
VADNSAAIIWAKDLGRRYLLINGSFESCLTCAGKRSSARPASSSGRAGRYLRAVDQQVLAAGTAVQAEETTFPLISHHLSFREVPLRDAE